jgi:RND family efflux transporter MFP subunit
MRTTRLCTLALAALLAACGKNQYQPPPPPEVTVAQPIEQEVTTYSEFTGHTASIAAVDIRARVQGFLESFHFVPGTDVKQGDLLFVIEPELYEAQAQQAAADLDAAQARAQAAEAQLAITRSIYEKQAGSKTDLVQKQQARDESVAAVAQAKARLAAAKLNLSYTHIYAPITGRIDRNLVDPGNLVGSGDATLLASIVSTDPIYAYFDASERELLRYREMQRRGETAAPEGERNKAYLGLATEDGFPHVGEVDYSDNRVDPTTGTIEIRAVFPNAERVLLPGLFARVRLPLSREKSLLVPDVAIGTDQGGRYVLVVDDKDAVQYRQVKLGSQVGEMRVVTDGVKPGEWVIVNGMQHARPGSTVKPVREAAPTTPPTADATTPTP